MPKKTWSDSQPLLDSPSVHRVDDDVKRDGDEVPISITAKEHSPNWVAFEFLPKGQRLESGVCKHTALDNSGF